MQRIAFPISHEHANRRLDSVVHALVPNVPHAELRRWLRKGFVRKNHGRTTAETRVVEGDTLWLPPWVDAHEDANPPAHAQPSLPSPDIRYEDEDLLVAYKPAGLASHPGIGHHGDSLSARLAAHVAVGPGCKVGLAQRLDAGVSGLIPCGKHAVALKALMGPPHGPPLVKLYAAVVVGRPALLRGDIVDPLRVTDQPRGDVPKVVVDHEGGQSAHSRYVVLATTRRCSLVVVRIFTGRTHQIRAHLRAIDTPIWGDPRYGHRADNEALRETHGIVRPLLHAGSLRLRHPIRHEQPVEVHAPWPADFERVMGSSMTDAVQNAWARGDFSALWEPAAV